jgi:hypothetical protein
MGSLRPARDASVLFMIVAGVRAFALWPERRAPDRGRFWEAWVFGRTEARVEPWQAGFAVRRDWSVDGSHEFVGFRLSAAEAGWFAESDHAYWRRGPVRPSHCIMEISARDFELHVGRRTCRSPDCPGTSAALVSVAGAAVSL